MKLFWIDTLSRKNKLEFYIHVKVSISALLDKIQKINEDHFEISVKEKAERNIANRKTIELIAGYFDVPPSKIRIVNGHRHRSKLLVINRDN